MKPCDQWRGELANHVLGAPAGPALAAHLEKCGACSAARTEWQKRMGQIDAGIRRLAASEPSTDAASRVMEKVRSRRRRSWMPEWRTAAAAVAGLILVAASTAWIWKAQEQRKQTQQALSAAAVIGGWQSPTQGLLGSPTHPWLNSVPRLGEYFYELKANSLNKEKENR
jgi:hypothetical protein